MEQKSRIDQLIEKFIYGSATDNEMNELKTWVDASEENFSYCLQQTIGRTEEVMFGGLANCHAISSAIVEL